MKKKEVKNTEDNILYIAGYLKKENKFIALQVRNTQLLNPLQPIFENYPDIECLVVGTNEKVVKKYFKKLL